MVNPPRKFDFCVPTKAQLVAIASGLQPTSYINSQGMSSAARGLGSRGLGAGLNFVEDEIPLMATDAPVEDDLDIVITGGPEPVPAPTVTKAKRKRGEDKGKKSASAGLTLDTVSPDDANDSNYVPEKPKAKRGRPKKVRPPSDDGSEDDNDDDTAPAKKKTRSNMAAQKFDLETAMKMEALRLQLEMVNIKLRKSALQEIDLKARLLVYESERRFYDASTVKLDQEATYINLKSYCRAKEMAAAGKLDKNAFHLPSLDSVASSDQFPSIPPITQGMRMTYVTEDITGASGQWSKPSGRLTVGQTLDEEPVVWNSGEVESS
ncbi:hypothetical protein BV22DRAFT_1125602 [Leucogyrophana mollusca]|uniref:Uncharacterized protein n=1 Tax=Leucogyrophana mollusca TaxID=85980 RepID=A0ACB8BUR3_9AGAM|nr:hypothetical protein BV22DRAFT_1125602 [Leucogyrophana mollusca]